jgi:hypothetical protein
MGKVFSKYFFLPATLTWATCQAQAAMPPTAPAQVESFEPSLLPAAAVVMTEPVSSVPAASLNLAQSAEQVARGEARWRRQWVISLATLVAAQTLDAASSYGMRELNPLLASANGGFGLKAVAIKFATMGAFMGVESMLVRKHPKTAKMFTLLNWTAAGVTASFAVHNYQLPGR